jgi:hypothetical protein
MVREELDGPAVSALGVRSAIAESKQCSQRPVIGWMTKIYYLELLRASGATLSRWSWLYLQLLAPTPARSLYVVLSVSKVCATVVKSAKYYMSLHRVKLLDRCFRLTRVLYGN